MQYTTTTQSPSSVNTPISWVVISESDMSESVLYSFETHVLTLFLRFGLGVPFGLILEARSWIPSFSGVSIRITDFSLQPSTTSAYVGCSPWTWTNLFCSHFLLQRDAYLCHWSCCQAALLEQRVHYSHHKNRCRFRAFITKSFSWKWPNTYLFTPRHNRLNHKWNWMCRGDYSPTCEIRDQGYCSPPPRTDHRHILSYEVAWQ